MKEGCIGIEPRILALQADTTSTMLMVHNVQCELKFNSLTVDAIAVYSTAMKVHTVELIK